MQNRNVAALVTKKAISFTAFLLIVCMIVPLLSPVEAEASGIPTRRTMRIGLSHGSTAVPSANLINADGSGFELGYYDSDLKFTAITSTSERSISIMVDRNMQWNPSAGNSGQYELAPGSGLNAPTRSPSIGFAHIRMNTGRTDWDTAMADLGGRSDGFIRYNAGSATPYVPMYGHYTSRAAADTARSASFATDDGSSTTITVAALGTDRILFEYDNRDNKDLIFGVRPINHSRPVTHYKGFRYLGGFRYERLSATALTVVNIVNLEDYVQGVIPYEMSGSWPREALKAQAICARTYALATLGKHGSAGFDLCDTADCQVYRGVGAATANSNAAVTETAGQVVTYGGDLIGTYYSSSHGGGSENNENIWAGSPRPYLRGVLDNYEDAVSSSINLYNWTLTISQSELTTRVRNAGYSTAATIETIRVSQYSPTGNVVSVTATDTNGREYTFSRRSGLQSIFSSNLRSQRFNIGSVVWTPGGPIYVNSPAQPVTFGEYSVRTGSGVTAITGDMTAIDGSGNMVSVSGGGGSGITAGLDTAPVNGNFILTGKGWGHSVGMSQWGAYSQALHYNRTAEQIIKHYYTGVTITQT